MTNAPQQIGQYHVQSELGRGGMGVVYLAHDSRLDRQVAIKALPSEVTVDAERLARFEREARTLAQLNHPNLAGIHGVEVDGDQRFLVLEYVEGETLADVLERGPLPVDESLQVCAQIAAGVESAHDGGVIHRDLKPANIKITPDGKVKVLDFGLAKSSDPVSSTTNSQLPTLTTPQNQQSHTIEGAILGTAPYMSPEQARGRRVDRRSDVWSFGCILYECLTGARLFAGESATDSMGAILHKEIDFSLLPRETPARVRELLAKMLERDKERRLRDLGDAMLELEAARGEPGTAPIGSASAGSRGPGWPTALALIALAVVATGVVMWGLRPVQSVDVPAAMPHPNFKLTQLTDHAGMEMWPSLSPNGSTVVFSAEVGGDMDIFTRRVDGLNALNLTGEHDGGDYCPSLSPDGRRIAFASERNGGGLYVMGATGESPRRLTATGFDPAWSPDGARLVYATEFITDPLSRMTRSQLWTVDVNSGDAEMLYEGDAVQPSWSPSGDRIAFWRVHESGQRDIVTIAQDGTDPIAVTSDAPTDWSPVWSPDGRWLYFSSDRGGSIGVWRIAIDERTGVTSGDPQLILPGLTAGAGYMSFSGDGRRMSFVTGASSVIVFRQDLDPATGQAIGEPTVVTPFTTKSAFPTISPDGQSVAYANTGERQEDIYIISSDGTRRQRVTNDQAKDRGPQWTPDGSRLIFYSDRGGKYSVWSIRTDGGDLQELLSIGEAVTTPELSPDGKHFAVIASTGETSYLFKLEPGAAAERLEIPALPEGYRSFFPVCWSPDSRKLLIFLVPTAERAGSTALLDLDSGACRIVNTDSEYKDAVFTPDGESIITRRGDNQLVRINLETQESTLILTLDPGQTLDRLDLARDGSWLIFLRAEVQTDLWMLEFQDQ